MPPLPPASGPSDRRSEHIQRHPEKLSWLQTSRGPGLSAAPAALAVVLQPAGALLAGRLVASLLHSNKTTMDWQTHICKKGKSKTRSYILLLSNTCCTFISLWIPSLLLFLLSFHFMICGRLVVLFCLFVCFLHCSCVLKQWPTICVNSVWQCVLFGFRFTASVLLTRAENTRGLHSNKPQLVTLGKGTRCKLSSIFRVVQSVFTHVCLCVEAICGVFCLKVTVSSVTATVHHLGCLWSLIFHFFLTLTFIWQKKKPLESFFLTSVI